MNELLPRTLVFEGHAVYLWSWLNDLKIDLLLEGSYQSPHWQLASHTLQLKCFCGHKELICCPWKIIRSTGCCRDQSHILLYGSLWLYIIRAIYTKSKAKVCANAVYGLSLMFDLTVPWYIMKNYSDHEFSKCRLHEHAVDLCLGVHVCKCACLGWLWSRRSCVEADWSYSHTWTDWPHMR